MPKFDKTGPQGLGPKTGRGMGPCVGCAPCMWGMGMGFGKGRGCCGFFGCGYPQTKKEQKTLLSDYKKALLEELEDVKKEEEKFSKIK